MNDKATDGVEVSDDELALAAGGTGGQTGATSGPSNNTNSIELVYASTFIPFDSSF